MRVLAWVVLITAIIVLFLGCSMDVSVPTANGGRVNNIGLMNEKNNYITFGGMLLIGGIIIFVASKRKGQSDNAGKSLTDQLNTLSDMKKNGILSDSEFETAKTRLLEKNQGQ